MDEILENFIHDGIYFDVTFHSKDLDDHILFKVSEVNAILGISNIDEIFDSFDENFKIDGYLTEYGLFRLLMISNKPIAHAFYEWITGVIIYFREQNKTLKIEKIKLQQIKDIANLFEIRNSKQKQATETELRRQKTINRR
jgi:prophage antirepressor-like protein